MRRADFHFELPTDLIAQRPVAERTGSRLLELKGDALHHHRFDAVVDLLHADDLLVVNDTRVIKARLRGRKDTGGHAEIVVERLIGECRALCQVRVSKPLKAGRRVIVGETELNVIRREGDFYLLDFGEPVAPYLERFGRVPLPPYIDREADAKDEDRYQTVYASVCRAPSRRPPPGCTSTRRCSVACRRRVFA